MANDKVYLSFEDLFKVAKQRTELTARGVMDDALGDRMILTDSDKEAMQSFFNEGVSKLQSEVLTFERLKNYDGTLKYTTTDEQHVNFFKEAKNLIEKVLIQYLLWAWYDSILADDLAKREIAKYQVYISDLSGVGSERSVVPKWRPYF